MKQSIYILLSVAIVLILTAGFVLHEAPKQNLAAVAENYAGAQSVASPPALLIIPKIGVEAKVEDVGVTASGSMATPEDAMDVGWYKYGTMPGETGSAVFAGHLDDVLGLPAVFQHLNELATGDDVYVVGEDGKKLHFRVTGEELYDYDAKDTSAIFSPKDAARLNLITCDGSWIKSAGVYDKRLVVFTELVPDPASSEK